ncbi:phospho-N-acetylmuramoyl-pentapeptide-transferase [Candidatus Azambacteria bacterium RIFCSPHIGHO2_02_FULL_52_12]|uniref:Phospho-N-acetylmuramoyl-pentapeptide-transferase n=1 Tax=Candidatus Azambacteria bacterium RIFCSPLOWO2_01_FULL_46_25 TaxID=1797298 RepID=A0A1F5BW15_9BACT|nr:MAG: phospho-N-acetylmuramoyl-pentapeptide-transferase [Candidatus Azambacteria bacterium RIFCSPHIGHO2_02_FULL_52_12]OGD34790.1 MAG: phospho-N-acetylmuramoyl-pentapeptide-transferase [Candidatus Azambacteria bacterium RIFCSPLOWO2_01_FULL_46_25]OGD37919.1 MAG: phospho-N-acetylmuramoyl-pentapeptide-transferase [Candidatus Azambacteria bacterium RIFCSPHIGHO2_01_FULL_51_74]
MTDPLLIIKILGFSSLAFVVAILWTPILTYFLYKYKMGKQIRAAESAPIFNKLHAGKAGTPTMGGILIWGTTLAIALVFLVLAYLAPESAFAKLNFLTREQTYLPLGILVLAALVGLADDLLGVLKIGTNGGGLTMKHRIVMYTAVAAIGAYWFYFKLGWSAIHVPFLGDFEIGLWYLPLFVFIVAATAFSVNETDGLDGLAGGVVAIAFAAYIFVAAAEGKTELAVLCSVIVGALMAFLWFNINPARFFMGDTGAMSLGVTLGVMAMLTDTMFFLPLFGLVLVFESASVLVQVASKKLRGKKIFLSTPIHHHFEALGWPETKVTMRFWIISALGAFIGIILFVLERSL